MPPPIGFDVDEGTHIPPSQQTFLCNQESQGIVRQFLEQYFLIFDSDNRQPLLQAYHEQASFSMTSCYSYGQQQKGSNWLNWYSTDCRNVLKVRDPDRRMKTLKQSQLSVVSFLSDMPLTKHDIHSFTVDLTLCTVNFKILNFVLYFILHYVSLQPQMLVLSVSGMFKELKTSHKTPPIRHFFRTLVIVPAGSGYCIANEEVHITNATDEQIKVRVSIQ